MYTGSARTTLISKLTPDTSYMVRVSALNQHGQSTPCAPQTFMTTPRSEGQSQDNEEEDEEDGVMLAPSGCV